MEGNSVEEKWEGSNFEEEDEALSLCDLPVNMINIEDNKEEEEEEVKAISKTEEDFDFGSSWGASISAEPEMCAADDVFFKGQILPSRLSVSSETGFTKTRLDSQDPSRCVSRSESMDRSSLGGSTSYGSRSSSCRSHYSSSSNTTTTTTSSSTKSKPRIGNNFLTHPSPKPQIRVSSNRPGNAGNYRKSQSSSSSSVWDFFRLGLVRTPEIELQDLKARNSVSRNSSSSSSNSSSSSIKNVAKIDSNTTNYASKSDHGVQLEKQRKQSTTLLDKRRLSGGLFSGGCKCSVNAIEAVPLNNIVIIKSNTNHGRPSTKPESPSSSTQAMIEKLQQLKQKQNQHHHERQEGKQSLSRNRTFEWLKQLSHASYPD